MICCKNVVDVASLIYIYHTKMEEHAAIHKANQLIEILINKNLDFKQIVNSCFRNEK